MQFNFACESEISRDRSNYLNIYIDLSISTDVTIIRYDALDALWTSKAKERVCFFK